ncbi:hypothetical protein AB3X55_04030 [Alphaproteobacteria bacterium LSUCC0719]
MDQDFVITALIRQGCRQCETSPETGKIRFEWRDQNINIPPPFGKHYSAEEVQEIRKLIERQTDYELDLPDQSASGRTEYPEQQPKDSDS